MINLTNEVVFKAQQSQSNKNGNKKNVLSTLPVDLAMGGIAGGIVGLTSKPWQLNGQLTDEFVASAVEEFIEINPKDFKGFENTAKGIFKLNLKEGMSKEAFLDLVKKNPDVFNIENLSTEEFIAKIEKEINTPGVVDDFINFFIDTKKGIKNSVSNAFSDVEKGKLKQLEENAGKKAKNAYDFLKNTLKKMKVDAGLKWAGIGAIAMAGCGILMNIFAQKAQAKRKAQ